MARSLKTRGIMELSSLRSRVRRQHTLGRIRLSDANRLVSMLDEVEAYIVGMEEHGDDIIIDSM